MIKKIVLIALCTSLGTNCLAKSNLSAAGDITQILVPLGALGIATYKGDTEGQKEFAKSFLTTIAITYALKYSLKDTEWGSRPNGGTHSFPSGHTAAASSGAFFLNTRYGFAYGAPAMALSAFTGYTRVKGKYHHWRDVIGGAAISFGANYFFVSKYQDKVQVSTNFSKDTAALSFNVKL